MNTGNLIINQGDKGDKFFIAYTGNYDVYINGSNDAKVLVHKYESSKT